MESFKFYEVGGKIRDELLGLKSKDVDYVAVPSPKLLKELNDLNTLDMLEEIESDMTFVVFNALQQHLEQEGFEIFLVTPECYTIRAKFPAGYKYQGVADFVMARKEVGYIPGTRTPIVEPGDLLDDLSRRDFTVNAMAKDPDTGEIIDYFGGMRDLENKVLKTPLDPQITFDDDPLRILRCIRFSVTKGFEIPRKLKGLIHNYSYNNNMKVVSEERIREELLKCFKYDTPKTISILGEFTNLSNYIWANTKLWLKPTSEQ